SASSMVIVAAIALSTMVSNHVVMPIWLAIRQGLGGPSGDVRGLVLMSRRLSIAAVLGLGFFYYQVSGGGAALAAIGLISFCGVVQILPALIGGLFWRGATRVGALAGTICGFAIWVYTLLLPSIGPEALMTAQVLEQGPAGIAWLRPQGLFGIAGLDPVVHCMLWSMLVNTMAFCVGSVASFPGPLERLQGAQFVNAFDDSANPRGWSESLAETEDLLIMAQRILGARTAQSLFLEEARAQGKTGYLPDSTPEFLDRLERELAGSVGAATAHAMVGQIMTGSSVSVGDLLAVADETAQIMEYSSQLEAKSRELQRTARQLRMANDKLTQLSVQQDTFLSQISHELRTPMTSIRAFSEILKSGDDLSPAERTRYSSVIHDEALRLTRLLDALLDLSVLEDGRASLVQQDVLLHELIDRAILTTSSLSDSTVFEIRRDEPSEKIVLRTDADRLSQVFINLVANARKYCDAPHPRLEIRVARGQGEVTIDFVDNGSGIPAAGQQVIFEKFARLSETSTVNGAGLGLAICREIMTRLGGSVTYLPGQGGAAFRVTLPALSAVRAA
ncbi:MAG: ATP-binding protein, partial [Mangrovicoccus sp.]|nr:ATP-binding protein [Mangrovicoccus sp.]